jgi:DNA-binding transcriptional LysR family regulator
MDVRQLRCFLAVAEEMSFTRAAERLHVVQPAVSNQIKRLEAELEVALFDRSRRTITLTAAGQKLLIDGSRILDELEQTTTIVKRLGSGATGHLTVAFPSIVPLDFVAGALRGFKDRHPAVELTLKMPSAEQAVLDVELGRADVAFLYLPDAGKLDLERLLLGQPELMVTLPAGHRLERAARVDLIELADEEFLFPAQYSTPDIRSYLRRVCTDAGFEPIVSPINLTAIEPMLALAAHGFGHVLIPHADSRWMIPRTSVKPLQQPALLPLYVIWRGDVDSQPREAFIRVLSEALLGLRADPIGLRSGGADQSRRSASSAGIAQQGRGPS